ncbi:hypothetical protein B0T21DRAFT_25373 [Apiosordaria backusii]|uniref:BHLH domain-containing protein n=1 Tax=Apiosordaria backusii TaxID=314023 RepID=A0AA40EZV9_9PEZI|nr:hypothetical protein B0T21DRAFT_25373 [Apiosordaria backusii]
MGDYVSPIQPPQPGFDFPPPWPTIDDGTMSLGTASPNSLMSPVMQSYEMVASPTGSGIDRSTMGMYGGPENWQQLPPQASSRTNSMEMGSPAGKRAKHYAEQSASPVIGAPQPNPSSTSSTAKTKLRSASRTSKNAQNRSEETPQERKSRNSHNLVEKQYRNRLNAQFEILMNTLPESMRSPTTTASGADSDAGQGVQGGQVIGLDLGERRLSKAQVLDMSTRYIRSLEKEREKLEREREELLLNMSKMREAYEKDGTGSGPGSGSGSGSEEKGKNPG